MSRQLFALALLLVGIIVAIVRGQEQKDASTAGAPRVLATEQDDVWSEIPSDEQIFDGEGKPVASGSRYSVAPAAAEDVEDGTRSVLKRRTSRAASSVSDDDSMDQPAGNYSSRRSTGASRDEESEAAPTAPVLTARNSRAARGAAARNGSAAPAAAASGLKLSAQSASLRVDAVGPAAIMVGKPANYQLTITNEGAQPALDVAVSIALPGNVAVDNMNASAGEPVRGSGDGGILWTLRTLAGGASEQLTLQLTPSEDRPFSLGIDWTTRAGGMAATVDVQKPALALQIAGPDEIVYGASQQYTITITNPGTGPAENVTLDVAAGGNGGAKPIGTIPAGGQKQIPMELIAHEAGSIEINATVSADGLRETAQKVIVVRRAELAVEITGPAHKFAGTTGAYQIQVTNKGNAPAEDVEMSLRLPPGIHYAGGLDQAHETAGRLTWVLQNLAENESQEFTISVQYESAGTLVCEIAASGAGDLAAAAQCETEVEAVADLTMVVSDPPGPGAVGDDVTYEIRITNRGSKAAESIEVIGQFAAGIEPIRADGHAAELVTGQVIFKPIARIDAGQTLTLKIVARADKAGNHRFRAVLKCSDPDTELIAEDTTRFFGDDSKSAGRKSSTKR